VPKRLANKIVPLLHGSRPDYYNDDDRWLDMLFHSAIQLGLLKLATQPGGQKQRYLPGDMLKQWSTLNQVEQARILLTFWVDNQNHSWSDIAGANYRPDSFSYYMDTLSSRRGLLGYLAETCQPGQWYEVQAFLQTIKNYNPHLLRMSSRYALYNNNSQSRKTTLENWDLNDGEIITGFLDSTLHEFGLVTTGWPSTTPALSTFGNKSGNEIESASNPSAFQLTELAGKVFAAKTTAEEAASATTSKTGQHLIVQPNFELLLLHPDYSTLYQLLPFAKVQQIEMVSRLVLTQESVRRGVEAGWSVEQIIQTLQENSQKELPQNVMYTLQDWGRIYKNATVSQIIVLEVNNETVADEICASPKFRTLELRRLGPCAIAVGGQVSVQVLRSTLEKEGVIMRVQGDIITTPRDHSSTYYGKPK
jgi:hypothetical protein